ncbi:Type 4 prepilin-like proteins leader peptide-processing enzyme [Desulfonema limicola]|uniref:Prepilin leader peptidase/N-methyltransferase n=1 Tax=Desulfonema limicola TaxID=45656 RepID=A0A975GHK4_9BACT|nr:A24 family peptidase [Desulfonema limicola]QTA81507.1 Type 4 prepilin-like proteins leader peptide-processing enzyme [Desulfonema limicola]
MIFNSVQIYIVVFIFGLCIGSFLNVCIFRLPISKSIVYPPSSCPECGYMIKFYDNIPVLSYMFLLGRCRQCKTRISVRYPLIELLSGFFAVCTFLKFGLNLEGLVYYVFIAVLLVITFIDIDHRIIPNIISLPGIPIFFIAAFAVPSVTWQESVTGILTGGGSLYAVAWTYCLITGKEGMGGGDIKLLAMMGGLIGWKGVLFTIFVGSAVGTIAGLIVMLYTRMNMKLAVPFGPFLSIGAITYIFFGTEIIFWYFNLLR